MVCSLLHAFSSASSSALQSHTGVRRMRTRFGQDSAPVCVVGVVGGGEGGGLSEPRSRSKNALDLGWCTASEGVAEWGGEAHFRFASSSASRRRDCSAASSAAMRCRSCSWKSTTNLGYLPCKSMGLTRNRISQLSDQHRAWTANDKPPSSVTRQQTTAAARAAYRRNGG